MKDGITFFCTLKNLLLKPLLFSFCSFFFINLQAQQYIEAFTTAPAFTANPGVPSWMQTATVTDGGSAYEFVNSGDGGWEYKPTGGLGNSANLLYNSTASSTVTIKRQDGHRFQFYGAWLKYRNSTAANYFPPWLRVTYNGSLLAEETYSQDTTVVISQNVNVTSVTLSFSGLLALNFDHIIVGAAIPIPAFLTTDDISLFSDNSGTLGGGVTDDGGAPVTESGFVYSTSVSPTVADNKLVISSGVSSFSQTVTGLQSGIAYYVRSYAINSAGTSYGNEQSFTTFGTFMVVGTHNFNSAWESTSYQNSPFTKYVEGWDATGESTGSGLISINKLTGAQAGEGTGSLSIADNTLGESLMYMSLKPHSGTYFNLESFLFRYDVQAAGSSFGTITVTGYNNGIPVPGATQTILNIAPSGTSPAYHTFTANENAFDNINEFRLTPSNGLNGAMLRSFDIDFITASASVLPITYTSVKAYQKNSGILVEWKVAAENDVNHYEIEKSPNGQLFSKGYEVSPRANNYTSASYNWLDTRIVKGNNYYRIKSVFNTGEISYSQVMKVTIGGGKETITVNPNPVTGSFFNLQLTNQPVGKYIIQLFSITGRQLYNKVIVHNGGSATQTVDIGNILSKGSYVLKISGPLNIYTQQLIKY